MSEVNRCDKINPVKVTCDSTCDLGIDIYNKYNVTVTPLWINIGDKQYKDMLNISPEQLFESVEQTGVLPKTAAVNQEEYYNTFKSFTDKGYDIVHINISSDMSACNQNANAAAKEIGDDRVFVVDSLNLSTGSGHLVVLAAELAKEGKSAAEIKQILDEKRRKLEVSFVIQTLEYLHKGGRCSAVAALGANLLKLRPCIEVIDGKMDVGKKYRGNMQKVLEQYAADRLKDRDDLDTKRIFITHTGVDNEVIAKLKKLILSYQKFGEVIDTVAGGTISSHCGKGTLGILFFRK